MGPEIFFGSRYTSFFIGQYAHMNTHSSSKTDEAYRLVLTFKIIKAKWNNGNSTSDYGNRKRSLLLLLYLHDVGYSRLEKHLAQTIYAQTYFLWLINSRRRSLCIHIANNYEYL